MLHKILQISAFGLLLTIPVAQAQQQPSDSPSSDSTAPLPPLAPDSTNSNGSGVPPVPTVRGLFIGSDPSQQDPSQPIRDTHVLSDSEVLGLGLMHGRRNIFDPALHIYEGADTGVVPGVTNSTTTFGGSLSLDRFWDRNHLTLFYDGAATIYAPSSFVDSSYHNFSISQEIRWNRWSLRLRDDGQVSPQSTFGGLDLGEPGLLSQGQSQNTLAQPLLPGETVLTARTVRIQDVLLADVHYDLSRRTTLTFSAAYGWLHFESSGYVNSANFSGRAGYNYALNPKDSLAIIYTFNQNNFSGNNGSNRGNAIQAAYSRKVTGRLAFQVAAGPQFISLLNLAPGSQQQFSWSAFSALTYQMRRTSYGLQYSHGLSAGAGVFLGAENHYISANMNHIFTRNWRGSLNGGYSITNNLVTSATFANRFSAWSGGASLNRQVGHYTNITLSYAFVQQAGSSGVCPVLSCGVNSIRQVAGVTVNWHMSPIKFE